MGNRGFFGLFSNKAEDEEVKEEKNFNLIEAAEDEKPEIDGNRVEYDEQEDAVEYDEEKAQMAKKQLAEILDLMQFEYVLDVKKGKDGEIVLDIEGEDVGRIIGKDGLTLNALQQIIRVILSKKFQESFRISLDANNYRQRRFQSIRKISLTAAEDAKREGKEIEIPPMSASDRRIVHMILNEKGVKTESVGERDKRRVVVYPK